jgi:hypothetical protein
MSWTEMPSRPAPRAHPWPLELEVELCADEPCAATAEQLRLLTGLLDDTNGVSQATAGAHGTGSLVLVSLTVEAVDLHDAHDRACAAVHDGVRGAGLGAAILVAVRPGAKGSRSARRMG